MYNMTKGILACCKDFLLQIESDIKSYCFVSVPCLAAQLLDIELVKWGPQGIFMSWNFTKPTEIVRET